MTSNTLNEAIERLRIKFLDLLRQRLVVVHTCLEKGATDAEDLEQSLFVVHKVAGSAGTLGLKHLGDVARRCEETLLHDQQTTGTISAQSRAELDRFVTFANAVLETHDQLSAQGGAGR